MTSSRHEWDRIDARAWSAFAIAAGGLLIAAWAAVVVPEVPRAPSHERGAAVAVLAVVTLAVATGATGWLMSTILRRPRRRRRSSPEEFEAAPAVPGGRLVSVGLLLVAVAVVVGGLIVVHTLAGSRFRAAGPSHLPTGSWLGSHGRTGASTAHLGWDIVIALAVLVAVGVTVLVVRLTRRHPTRYSPAARPASDTVLQEALRRGTHALAQGDDPRAAIIGCYVEMQRTLDVVGLHRDVSQTPSELLAEAIGSGQIPSTAATGLTRLFERARFSAEPVVGAQRDEAFDMLQQMNESLGSR